MKRLMIAIGILLVIVVAGYATGFLHAFMVAFSESRRDALERHSGLPSCDSEIGIANAKVAIDHLSLLKMYDVTALGIDDIKTSSITKTDVECDGIVMLSSLVRGPVHYSFSMDGSIVPFLVRVKIFPDQMTRF